MAVSCHGALERERASEREVSDAMDSGRAGYAGCAAPLFSSSKADEASCIPWVEKAPSLSCEAVPCVWFPCLFYCMVILIYYFEVLWLVRVFFCTSECVKFCDRSSVDLLVDRSVVYGNTGISMSHCVLYVVATSAFFYCKQ